MGYKIYHKARRVRVCMLKAHFKGESYVTFRGSSAFVPQYCSEKSNKRAKSAGISAGVSFSGPRSYLGAIAIFSGRNVVFFQPDAGFAC